MLWNCLWASCDPMRPFVRSSDSLEKWVNLRFFGRILWLKVAGSTVSQETSTLWTARGHEGHVALMVNDVGVDCNFATPVIDRVPLRFCWKCLHLWLSAPRRPENTSWWTGLLDLLEHRMLGILGDCWAPGRPMEIFNPATDGAVVLFARLGIRVWNLLKITWNLTLFVRYQVNAVEWNAFFFKANLPNGPVDPNIRRPCPNRQWRRCMLATGLVVPWLTRVSWI